MSKRVGKKTFPKKTYKSKNDYVHKVARQEAKRVIVRNVETKYWDQRQIPYTLDYFGTSNSFIYDPSTGNYLSQGTGESAYLGQKITPMYVELRGCFHLNGDDYNKLRLVVLQVKGSNFDTPGTADILQSTGNAQTPLSLYDTSYIDRARILVDKTFIIDTYHPTKMFRVRIPMKRMKNIDFGDAIGTVSSGNIVMYFWSDSSAVTAPIIEWYSRLAYKDA